MISVQNMIHVWKTQRVEFVNFYAGFPQRVKVLSSEWTVVGRIAESVEQCPHLDSFFGFGGKEPEQFSGYGVIAKIEVFQVDTFSGLCNSFEQVVKFLLPVFEENDSIVVRKFYVPTILQIFHDKTIRTPLRIPRNGCTDKEEKEYQTLLHD